MSKPLEMCAGCKNPISDDAWDEVWIFWNGKRVSRLRHLRCAELLTQRILQASEVTKGAA